MRANPGHVRLPRLSMKPVLVVLATVVTACTGTGAGPSAVPVSAAPAPAASQPPEPAASESSAGGGRGDYGYGDETEASPASIAPGPATVQVNTASGPLGTYLTGAGGLTLYTFKPDTANTSTCVEDCAQAWPPFTVGADDTLEGGDGVGGVLTSFARPDGTLQVAYDGAPLYYYANDKSAGDTNGQGLGDAWFVAEP